MDHYVDGSKSCPDLENTLDAIVNSCFFQEPLTIGFVARWIEQNCERIIFPIHKFCIHTLTTLYRNLEQQAGAKTSSGLELQTPILEVGSSPLDNGRRSLLTVSVAWVLAASLPTIYSRPQSINNPNTSANEPEEPERPLHAQTFQNRLLSVVPSHWTLLYDSNQDGLGANRFLHHVLGYKGPTLIFIKGRDEHKKDLVYCIASSTEWKETHLYTGKRFF